MLSSSIGIQAISEPNNTLSSAHNIGTLSSGQTSSFNDFVGNTDIQDYYRFSLSATSNLNLSLTGLSADADVKLLQDSNNDGVFNYYDQVLQTSDNSGSTSEAMLLDPIAAGTYYVQVYQGTSSINTNYSLSLKATKVTDNSLGTAKNIGTLSGSRSFNNFVGNTDIQDFYRFSLSSVSDFKLSLTGLSADADVMLIKDSNSNGKVDYGEDLKTSELGGSSSESISYFGLAAGTYYVKVYQGTSGNNTNYRLSLTQSSSDGFNNDYGYGLVNAAAAVAKALGQSTFANVSNLGGTNWGLDLVNAPEVWAKGYTGQGIVVAVVDTGVDYNHSDLNANIWRNSDEIAGNGKDDDGNGYIDDIRGWDFVNLDNDPMDLNEHGTHVAGTIAAENNGFGVTGVAYNAKIMPVRVLDANGSGSESDVALGIRYAADNGANVINLSLGGDYDSGTEAAIEYATAKGSVVVMAAGNDGGSQPIYPARHATRWGIAVGAVDDSKTMASFSNRAGDTKLDYVVAPGVDVYSTAPNNSYQYLSGTSMATPHVAGVVALLLSAKKSLTPAQVENILTTTATPTGITV